MFTKARMLRAFLAWTALLAVFSCGQRVADAPVVEVGASAATGASPAPAEVALGLEPETGAGGAICMTPSGAPFESDSC